MSVKTKINLGDGISKKIEAWRKSMIIDLKVHPKECARYSKLQIDVWNHVMNFMRPKEEISVIRKNILINDLSRLRDSKSVKEIKLDGLKNRKDLERAVLHQDLKTQFDDNFQTYSSLKKTLEKQSTKVVALEKEKEKVKDNTKEINKTNTLLKMNLKRIDGMLKTTDENLDTAKTMRNVIADRVKPKENDSSFMVNIDNILSDIEALYHSDDLGDGQVDLTMETTALWEKVFNYIFISPQALNDCILKELQKTNSELEAFLKTSVKSSPEAKNVLDYIHVNHVKLFLQVNNLKNNNLKISREIDSIKQDLCMDFLSKFSSYLSSIDSTENFVMKNLINRKCDEIIKTKKKEFLKIKTEELESLTSYVEFDLSLLSKQADKFCSLNKEIEEKAKIISKYNSVILNNKWLVIDDQIKNFVSNAVQKFNQLNVLVNEKRERCKDSNTEDRYIFAEMEGIFKNEIELLANIPLNTNNQFQLCNAGTEQLSATKPNSDFSLPYRVLSNKTWIKVLNNLQHDLENKLLVQQSSDSDENIREHENELKCRLADSKKNIDSTINTARKHLEVAMDYSLLLDESSCLAINKILCNKKVINNSELFVRITENFKKENNLNL